MFIYKHFVDRNAGTEMDDIVRNLGFLLRSKRGCGSFLESFGVDETGYRTPADMVARLSEEIRTTVECYEPRVEVTEIDEEHDGQGRVSLAVQCRVRSTDERLRLSVDSGLREFDVAPDNDNAGDLEV